MKIGNVEIAGQVFLAPMAGITNVAYRDFMKKFGVAVTYSEMVSDCGLIYGNKETYKYLETLPSERPVAIQLFGGKKETLLQALQILQNGSYVYDFIDINLGCPVPKVTKTGAGAAWLKREDELFEMMSALVKESKTPVTAKIRLGWDENTINVEKIVSILQDAGVSLITIHPRTRNQLYSGKADYLRIKDIKKIMRVPLVISGDIFTLESAIEAQQITHADAIMVARGAMGNPLLITQIDKYLQKKEKIPNATLKEQCAFLREYALKLIALKGETVAIRELRGISPHFFKGYPNLKLMRVKLATEIKNFNDLELILHNVETNML